MLFFLLLLILLTLRYPCFLKVAGPDLRMRMSEFGCVAAVQPSFVPSDVATVMKRLRFVRQEPVPIDVAGRCGMHRQGFHGDGVFPRHASPSPPPHVYPQKQTNTTNERVAHIASILVHRTARWCHAV